MTRILEKRMDSIMQMFHLYVWQNGKEKKKKKKHCSFVVFFTAPVFFFFFIFLILFLFYVRLLRNSTHCWIGIVADSISSSDERNSLKLKFFSIIVFLSPILSAFLIRYHQLYCFKSYSSYCILFSFFFNL